MDKLSALDMLLRASESGSFSAAARELGLTPAAVSKQVGKLERSLGKALVTRSTRQIALTDDGRLLLQAVAPALGVLQQALSELQSPDVAYSGTLRVSMAPGFGRHFVMPALGGWLEEHPALTFDGHFDNRAVDLIAEGFDAAVSGGVELPGSLVARELAPLHLVLVAAPAYLAQHGEPRTPEDLHAHRLLPLRSPATGRPRPWHLIGERDVLFEPPARHLVNDPEAVAMAARLGWGIGLAGLPHVHRALADGTLRRVLPGYWADGGAIRVYHAHGRLVPAKVRGFVDVLVAASRAGRWHEVLSGGRRARGTRTPASQRPAGPKGSRRLRERL